MRFASLGSGSQGNGLVVATGETAVLVDCGFSLRATTERLGRLGLAPDDLSAVLVTHEHSDHLAGVFPLARRFSLPVYLTHGTWQAAREKLGERAQAVQHLCRVIQSHAPFVIGDLEVQPFPVPHDAREPVQYALGHAQRQLGVLTDTGWITPHIVEVLRSCDALVLEFNHDRLRLSHSAYPPMLKRRIAGDHGHLENEQALGLLRQIGTQRLQHLVAAHLSEENNCPQRVLSLMAEALAPHLPDTTTGLAIADQKMGCAWRALV